MAALLANSAVFAIDPVYEGDNGIRAKVLTNCLKCHSSSLSGSNRNGAPPDVNFDTYEAAKAKAGRAVERAVYLKTMPPTNSGLPKLDSEQQAAILAWQSGNFPRSSTVTGTYDLDTGILKLDVVNILAAVGNYSATLKLSPNSLGQLGIGFTLTGAGTTEQTSDNLAYYTPVFGQVHLPKIDLVKNGVTQSTVTADLLEVKGSNPLQFLLGYYELR